MASGFVPIEGFDPGIAIAPDHLRIGDRFYLTNGMALLAVDLSRPAHLWTRTWPRPAPVHYQVPRRPHSNGRRLWSSGDRIVCLVDTERGVAAVCCEAASGRELWQREITTPAPADWTETKPAWPGAQTEEIDAGFLGEENLAVVFARTTRRTMQWPEFPAPPFRSQLDVHALDALDGTIRASTQIPGVRVPILEKQRLGRWLVADRRLLELDSLTGNVRTIAELPNAPCWPRARGRKVSVAWRGRGSITVATVDGQTGKIDVAHEWKRKAVKALDLRLLSDGMALQVNDQFVDLLDDHNRPVWEVRVRPYVYGTAAHAGGPVFVAAAGGGGGLAAFARHDGSQLVEARLPGGAWDPTAVAATDLIVAACGEGLVTAKTRASAVTTDVRVFRGVRSLVDVGRGRIALLCGDPAPGIHVICERREMI